MNKQKIDEHLQEFDNKFRPIDPALTSMVHSMLKENEAERPTANGITNFARPNNIVYAQPPVQTQTNDFFNKTHTTTVNSQPMEFSNPYIVKQET